MSKPKSKGLHARVSRAWNKVSRTPSSTAPPSQASTPNLPSVVLSPPVSASPEAYLPGPLSGLPVLAVPVSSLSAPFTTAATSRAPSLRVPEALQDLPSAKNEENAWSGLRSALQTLHAHSTLFLPLRSVIGELLLGFELFEESTRNQKESETLALELKMMSETLDQHLQGPNTGLHMDSIVKIIQSIQGQVNLIAKEQNSMGRRVPKTERLTEALSACDRLIQALCRQLQLDASLGSVTEKQRNQLKDLDPAKLVPYDSSLAMDINRRACTENTRTGVLSDVRAWLANPGAPNLCWMNGMAGTGKTTIAYTFAQELEESKQLAASFFCTRTTTQCRDVARIVPTIAYQLARQSAPFLQSLCRILREDPDVLSRSMTKQFEQLLKQPLLEVKDTTPSGLVVVIDALDECTASNGVNLILDILLRGASDLPLKFFVTSRPESSIRSKIQEQSESVRSVYELHSVKPSDVQADIELYLREELPSVAPPQLKQLAEQCGSLFIYAATAARYIRAGNIEERLALILSAKFESKRIHAEIDELYTTILSAAFTKVLEQNEEERMRLVLRTAVCAREPMSVGTLATLAGISDPKKALEALEPLRSVLYVSEDSNVVSTLHASFPDYMLSSSRSLRFCCDQEQHNGLLARRCFELMRDQLRFNICGLESPYVPDEAVLALDRRVGEAITPALAYACRYWADHLRQTDYSDDFHALLVDFLSERLLFWMEVMNLKRWMGQGVHVMLTAKLWIMTRNSHPDLLQEIEDARNFVTSFAANAVARSTPHIYVSALPFCHQSSAVYKHYRNRERYMITPKGSGITSRSQTVISSWKVDSDALSIAYSPEGTRIAIGCDDGSIIIKDAHDGSLVGTPLEGHTGSVNSVAFSLDGMLIASGSDDYTIRIWDARDGGLIGPPLKGHAGPVKSVALSLDGACVVSGSHDNTIRTWNARDGSLIGAPLKGHTNWVNSIAFSVDAIRIASGSEDFTIRIWNAQNGSLIGAPLQGHTSSINSVAFSPDGIRIVSGSDDRTVRIWDTQHGSAICLLLEGHTSWVKSVALSPDGARIVSGSDDNTIRVWNAQDGSSIGTPLKGHSRWVKSVAFSPGGTRIASSSGDNTICIWNMQDGSPTGFPNENHTSFVNSVAFSFDGSRIVSGSDDNTIRMWNAEDGTPMGAPLQGHTQWVKSVAFSSDGTRIVSGSHDMTIRIWNTQDGSPIGAPLEGHTDFVKSAAFSPDGTRIVSGSCDTTIRMWSAQNGSPIGAPLQGHTETVKSVSFSPDGIYIASGSNDNTICTWNAQDGSLIGLPLHGHTSCVNSVAFSPNCTDIVSGSDDTTIRMWNAHIGSSIGAPLKGHNGAVNSVAFSPDGMCIVSGSDDKTIRLWNAQDGSSICMPIRGHVSFVNSVAFSPDGAYIVSGADDSTIRMWRTQDGNPRGAPPQGYADSLKSAAFSPNGIHVTTGSHNGVVFVRDSGNSIPPLGWCPVNLVIFPSG